MTIMSSFTWIGFNFDNLCGKPTERAILLLDNQHNFSLILTLTSYVVLIALDGIDSKFVGETLVPAFGDNTNVVVNITSNSQMYKFCDQKLIERFAFPAIPSLQRLYGVNEWMSSEQELYSEIYGWSSLAFVVIVCIAIAYSFGYNLNKKLNVSHF